MEDLRGYPSFVDYHVGRFITARKFQQEIQGPVIVGEYKGDTQTFHLPYAKVRILRQ